MLVCDMLPLATRCGINLSFAKQTYRTEGISLSVEKYRKSRKGFISQNKKSAFRRKQILLFY